MNTLLSSVGRRKGRLIEAFLKSFLWAIIAGLVFYTLPFGIEGPLLLFAQTQGPPKEGKGQAAVQGEAAAVIAEEPQAVTKEAGTTVPVQETPRMISMDLQDIPLKELLKKFSQQAGMNFVASENIQNKKVTLYLENVTVENALNVILNANGLTFEQQPGTDIFIVKDAGVSAVTVETRIFQLNYAAVSGAAMGGETTGGSFENVIRELLSPNGKLVVDPRTNSLIISDVPSTLAKIEKVIKELDIKTQQVMICAEIIEVSVDTVKRLGIDWGSTSTGQFASYSGGSRSTFWPFKSEDNLFKGATRSTPSIGSISFTSFAAVLEALKTDTDTHYLARPRLLTLNNTTAEIKISKNAAVATTTVTTGGGAGITQSTATLERYDVGTILKVTPHINKDGYVTMTVEPEVSRVKVSGWNSSYYDPYTRSAKTTVMVKDGDTIVIAGLIAREDSDTTRKVPLLGEIPVLGRPFRKDKVEKSDTEIIIFITTYVVKDKLEEIAMAHEMGLKEPAIPKEIAVSPEALRKRRKGTTGLKEIQQLKREQDLPLTNRELLIEAEVLRLKIPEVAPLKQ